VALVVSRRSKKPAPRSRSRYDLRGLDPEEVAAVQARNPDITATDLVSAAEAVVSVQIQALKPEEATKAAKPDCCQSCCPND